MEFKVLGTEYKFPEYTQKNEKLSDNYGHCASGHMKKVFLGGEINDWNLSN